MFHTRTKARPDPWLQRPAPAGRSILEPQALRPLHGDDPSHGLAIHQVPGDYPGYFELRHAGYAAAARPQRLLKHPFQLFIAHSLWQIEHPGKLPGAGERVQN